jgi:hypothetical protein
MRAIAIVTLLAASTLTAQEPGARIRLAPSDGVVQIGALVALNADSVRIRDSLGAEFGYARADLRLLEKSEGRQSNVGRAAVRGAMIGAGSGFLLGVLASTEDNNWVCDGGSCIVAGIGGGAVWGLAIGAAIGALVKTEQWEPIQSSPVEPLVRPIARSTGVGVRLRF